MKVVVQGALGAALGGLMLAFMFYVISSFSYSKSDLRVMYVERVAVNDITDLAIAEMLAFFEQQGVNVAEELESLDFQQYSIGKGFVTDRWPLDVFIYKVTNRSSRSSRNVRVEINAAEAVLVYPDRGEVSKIVELPVEENITLRPGASAKILVVDAYSRSEPAFLARNSNVLFWSGEEIIELEGRGFFSDFPPFLWIKENIAISFILSLVGAFSIIIVSIEIVFSFYPAMKIRSICANATDKDLAIYSIAFDRVIEENPARERKIREKKSTLTDEIND